jgi:hypothetical protein
MVAPYGALPRKCLFICLFRTLYPKIKDETVDFVSDCFDRMVPHQIAPFGGAIEVVGTFQMSPVPSEEIGAYFKTLMAECPPLSLI